MLGYLGLRVVQPEGTLSTFYQLRWIGIMNEKIGGEAQGFRDGYFVSGVYKDHTS